LIQTANHYFNKILAFAGAGHSYIDEFMIPDLREAHREKMNKLLLTD
jgi:hypothetical protein